MFGIGNPGSFSRTISISNYVSRDSCEAVFSPRNRSSTRLSASMESLFRLSAVFLSILLPAICRFPAISFLFYRIFTFFTFDQAEKYFFPPAFFHTRIRK